MPTTGATRVLLLRDPRAAVTPDWRELERRLPRAERARDRETAVRCLEGESFDLIISDAVLPDGSPYGLLGVLIARRHSTTVVVHFRLPEGQRWLRLFDAGEFDLQAEPMTSQVFFRWLEERLAPSVVEPARANAVNAA